MIDQYYYAIIISEAAVMLSLKMWFSIIYVVKTWELFKRSFTHGTTTYTDELTQIGHYLAVANQ